LLWTLPLALIGVAWMFMPRGFPARWAGGIALAPMFLALPPGLPPGSMQVAVLDVGQGLAVTLRTAHHALLYDTGPRFSEDTDSGNRIIVPYLRGIGVSALDGLIVSHDDNDHSGGAASVLDAMPVAWLASSLGHDHPLFEHASRHIRCFAGQEWEWDGVHFSMLHPTWDSYADSKVTDNNRGCVLKVTSMHGSLLLPADIERAAEVELLERSSDHLRADVLVVPHHGSKTSSTPDFLHAVEPSVAIFTVGYRNRFGHPKAEIVEQYRILGSRLYRSDQDGAVLLDFSAHGIGLILWREAHRRYWQTLPAVLAETDGTG
jgi:competence protein ComEC